MDISTPSFDEKRIEQPSSRSEYRFEFTVEGMTCIKCVQKVEKALSELDIPLKSLKVDFITNRVLCTITNKEQVDIVAQKLKSCCFEVRSFRDMTHTIANERRVLTLKIIRGTKEHVMKPLRDQDTPLTDEEPQFIGNKCMISYNPTQVRGNEIVKKLQESGEFNNGEFLFMLENCFEGDVDMIKFSEFGRKQMLITLFINLLNIGMSFIPEEQMIVPQSFGMFSYYFVIVFLLTLLNLKYIGFNIYRTSAKQLMTKSNVNMMTLVSLGSALALFFGFLYSIIGCVNWIFKNSYHLHYFIMHSTHMFHTSATIFTSLVVGKYVEGHDQEENLCENR